MRHVIQCFSLVVLVPGVVDVNIFIKNFHLATFNAHWFWNSVLRCWRHRDSGFILLDEISCCSLQICRIYSNHPLHLLESL
jgi:hypothetical protein